VVQSSVCSVDVKSENEVRRESLHNENVDEKLIRNDAKGQEQFKEVEKKLSKGVKSENGGLVDPTDVEIRSKKKHEAGS
jgi:hypothetical protein